MAKSHDLLGVRQLARRVREQYSGDHGRAEQRPGQLLQVSVPEAQHALDRQLEQASDNMPGLREAQQQLQLQQQLHLQEQARQPLKDSCTLNAKPPEEQQPLHAAAACHQLGSQCISSTNAPGQGLQPAVSVQHAAVRPCSAPVPTAHPISAQSSMYTDTEVRAGSSDGCSVTHVAPWTELPPSYWAQHGLTLEQQLKQGGYESDGYDIKKTYVTASSSVQRVARPHNFTMSPDEVLRRELQAARDADKHLQHVQRELQAIEASMPTVQQQRPWSSSRPGSSSSILQLERDLKASTSLDQHAGRCTSAVAALRCTIQRPSSAPAASSVRPRTSALQQRVAAGGYQPRSALCVQQQISSAHVQRPVVSAGQVSEGCQRSQPQSGSAGPALRSHSGSTDPSSTSHTGSTGAASRPYNGSAGLAPQPHSGSTGPASRPHSGSCGSPAGSSRLGSAGLSRLGGGAACVEARDIATVVPGTTAVVQTIWEGSEQEEEALPVGDLALTADDLEPTPAPGITSAVRLTPSAAIPSDAEQPTVVPPAAQFRPDSALSAHRPTSTSGGRPTSALARPCSAGTAGMAAGRPPTGDAAAGRPIIPGTILMAAGRHGTAELAGAGATGRPASAIPSSSCTVTSPSATPTVVHTTTTARPVASRNSSHSAPQQSSASSCPASSTWFPAGQLCPSAFITKNTLRAPQPGQHVPGSTAEDVEAAECSENTSTATAQDVPEECPSLMLTAYSRIDQDCKARPWSAPCLRPFKPCLHTYVPIYTSLKDPAAPASPVGVGNTAVSVNALSGFRNVWRIQGNKLMQPTVACSGKYATHKQAQRVAIPTHGGRSNSSVQQSEDGMHLQRPAQSNNKHASRNVVSSTHALAKRQPVTAALQATSSISGVGGDTTITMLRDSATFVMPSDMMQRMLQTYQHLA